MNIKMNTTSVNSTETNVIEKVKSNINNESDTVLMSGPVGKGIHFIVKAIGAGKNTIVCDADTIKDAKTVHEVFRDARKKPSILVFEDVDQLFNKHDKRIANPNLSESKLDAFFNEMIAVKDIIAIGITHNIENVNDEVLTCFNKMITVE